jgi:hypothetical protein
MRRLASRRRAVCSQAHKVLRAGCLALDECVGAHGGPAVRLVRNHRFLEIDGRAAAQLPVDQLQSTVQG